MDNQILTPLPLPLPMPALANSSDAAAAVSSRRVSGRKRSRSSVEIFNLSTIAYDTKRARLGIQELSTTDSEPKANFSSQLPQPRSLRPPFVLQQRSNKEGPNSQSRDREEYHNVSGLEISNNEGESTSSSGISSDSDSDDEGTSGPGTEILGDEGYDSDSESGSTTTSSSSSSSGSDSEDGVSSVEAGNSSSRSATIGFPSPEQIRTSSSTFSPREPSALAKRLNSFLPQMAAANARLEDERERGFLEERNIEAVNDKEERYIEMNLGLGVLEEKHHKRAPSIGSDNDGDDDESEAGSGSSRTKGRPKKHDAMAALMGRRNSRRPEIQIVDG